MLEVQNHNYIRYDGEGDDMMGEDIPSPSSPAGPSSPQMMEVTAMVVS